MKCTPLLPLPTEHADDEPIYVNAKQYHAIIRRRQRRKIVGSEDKVAAIRKVLYFTFLICSCMDAFVCSLTVI